MTIGSFLGGVWANESWGRYWGWDPKETWSLITIIVYAFVLHMRFIPGMRGQLAFNSAAMVSIASVIMTYLGVNYYLAGMRSEEHTSELQSRPHLVCRLLLEKKKYSTRLTLLPSRFRIPTPLNNASPHQQPLPQVESSSLPTQISIFRPVPVA